MDCGSARLCVCQRYHNSSWGIGKVWSKGQASKFPIYTPRTCGSREEQPYNKKDTKLAAEPKPFSTSEATTGADEPYQREKLLHKFPEKLHTIGCKGIISR